MTDKRETAAAIFMLLFHWAVAQQHSGPAPTDADNKDKRMDITTSAALIVFLGIVTVLAALVCCLYNEKISCLCKKINFINRPTDNDTTLTPADIQTSATQYV